MVGVPLTITVQENKASFAVFVWVVVPRGVQYALTLDIHTELPWVHVTVFPVWSWHPWWVVPVVEELDEEIRGAFPVQDDFRVTLAPPSWLLP